MYRRSLFLSTCLVAAAAAVASAAQPPPPPNVTWTRFVSGEVLNDPVAYAATDRAGNMYLAGNHGGATTTSGGKTAQFGSPHAPGGDLWVAKLDPEGSVLWLRVLGGSGEGDFARGVAVLSDGRIAVGVITDSPDFPGAQVRMGQTAGFDDSVVTVLDPKDGAVLWSRYLGGSGPNGVEGVAPLPGGGVAVGGWQMPAPNSDAVAYAAALTADGAVRWKRTLAARRPVTRAEADAGYGNVVYGFAVSTDRSGQVYLAGRTTSPHLPASARAVERTMRPRTGSAAYVAAFRADGKALTWLSYLGGHGHTEATTLSVSAAGTVTVGGLTTARDFARGWAVPLRCTGDGAADIFTSPTDGFVAQFTAKGSRVRAACVGGTKADAISQLRVAGDGTLLAIGSTGSADFPRLHALHTDGSGGGDGFLVAFDSAGRLRTSTLVAGSANDSAVGVALLPGGDAVVSGRTNSTDFPGARSGDLDGPLGPDGTVHNATFVTRLHGV
jgi:hypothetical protein